MSSITEEMLQNRLHSPDAGSLHPQAFLTLTVCIGSFSFGSMLGWGAPAIRHMKELTYRIKRPEGDFAWMVTLAPFAGAIGILLWAFLTRRLGPRKTMLLQSPFNLLSWALMAYFQAYLSYNTARFFVGFFSMNYMYCGEMLLTETIHRKYQKIMYAFFKSSVTFGVLAMNILGPRLDKLWLCLICIIVVIANTVCLFFLPESPVHLMFTNSTAARSSLEWYRYRKNVGAEIANIAQYVYFIKNDSGGSTQMLHTKVIIKSLAICCILQAIRAMSGYYGFIFDSIFIFSEAHSSVSPYVDNIIFGVVLVFSRLIGIAVILQYPFGIKKPMLFSTFFMAFVLLIYGSYEYCTLHILETNYEKYLTLPILSLFVVAYEMGIGVCPDIVTYDYIPFQIYNFIRKFMLILQFALVFVGGRFFLLSITYFGQMFTLCILAGQNFLAYIFIMMCVVESKGKPLLKLQMELGGNPVGNRGSHRQRIASPMEHIDTNLSLQELINTSQNQSQGA